MYLYLKDTVSRTTSPADSKAKKSGCFFARTQLLTMLDDLPNLKNDEGRKIQIQTALLLTGLLLERRQALEADLWIHQISAGPRSLYRRAIDELFLTIHC
jgi:hypothetical protein